MFIQLLHSVRVIQPFLIKYRFNCIPSYARSCKVIFSLGFHTAK